MSFPLPNVDLTGAVKGTIGSISLNNVGISAGGVSANPGNTKNQASLWYFNDSGVGLQITFSQSGQGFNLPAGAWGVVPLPPGENLLTYLVTYALNAPPVSTLQLTYYAPGESIPQSFTLGNSPIGGSFQLASILSNEGGAKGLTVIDIGTVDIANLINIFNDHFNWKVEQSGVAVTVLQGATSGNPILIGQSGYQAEVLGSLTVDQTLLVVSTTNLDNGLIATDGLGNLTFASNNKAIKMTDTGSVVRIILRLDASNNTVIRAGGGNIAFRDVNNVLWGHIDATAVYILGKKINDEASHNLIDWTSGGVFLKGNPSTDGGFNYQANGANTDWTRNAESTGTGTTSTTGAVITHGLKHANVAVTPDIINIMPTSTSVAYNITAIGATTFTITSMVSTFTFVFQAIKF